MGKTFVEKIFNAKAGDIVFAKPDIVLSHDNTASIAKTFAKMGGKKVKYPEQLMIVLDHNAPPTNAQLANDYDFIRQFAKEQGVKRFHEAGDGICHQLMSYYAKPGMIIVGSDSHTCTAGAFNAFAAGIDRTETAGLWKRGETWFRVPQTMKITLKGKFQEGVYAKDLVLWIIGMIGSSGADYMSIEFHGEGVKNLTIAQRMTIANMASEMGAKNAVFPADEILWDFLGEKVEGIWADDDAEYVAEYEIDMSEIFPVAACPHHVDNVKSVYDVQGTPIRQGMIGTCTNGRYEDFEIAAKILKGKKIHPDVRLLIVPASKDIYLQMVRNGLTEIFIEAGANILSPSCGPCLGTGQGIPADNWNVISTANRNFLGRMGNKNASIYLASPATVAYSVINGYITDPRPEKTEVHFPYHIEQSETVMIREGDDRYDKENKVWDYSDVDNLNTDQMIAGNVTYTVKSSEPEKIIPHLFKGLDPTFSDRVSKGDIIVVGKNFGCGSSREHPSVGLSYVGVKCVICKSVARIFFRSSINQGLPVIVHSEAVDYYKKGMKVDVDFKKGEITVGDKVFKFTPLPDKLMEILESGGLLKLLSSQKEG